MVAADDACTASGPLDAPTVVSTTTAADSDLDAAVDERASKRSRTVASPAAQSDTTIQHHLDVDEEEKQEPALLHPALKDSSTEYVAPIDRSAASDSQTDAIDPLLALLMQADVDMTSAISPLLSSTRQEADPPTLGAAATASSKKTFPCRTCGALLSSASNRSRHERMSHGAPKKPPTKFVTIPSIPQTVPRRSRKRTAAEAVRDDRPSTISSNSRTNELLEDLDSDADDDAHEPEDAELQRYLTSVALGRTRSIDDGEEAKSSSSEEDRPASGSGSGSSSSSSPDSSSSLMDDEPIAGMPTLLSETELQSGCYAFLQWLAAPPLTPCEALVKAKRVKSLTQLQPVKSNLRFVFSLLNTKGFTHGKADLTVLTRLNVCQALFDILGERGVGSGRYHAIFLLCKKVLTFLSTQESTRRRQFVLPTIYDSFMYVDGICSDSGQQRRQEAQNRALLGAHVSQLLQRQQQQQLHSGQRPQPFAVPSQWSSPPGTPDISPSVLQLNVLPSVAAVVASNAAVSTPNEMTKDELKHVTRFCLAKLQECLGLVPTADAVTQGARDRWFQALLVTGTLCMGLAPRSQVLKQMRIGSTFIKEAESGRYVIRLLGDMCKNGRPTLVPLPLQLTPMYDYWLDHARPRLLAARDVTSESTPAHDYVFFRRNGSAPRADFGGCTHIVTQTAVGRKINAHAFRAAMVTLFHAGASQAEMQNLARVMAHDGSQARSSYYKPVFAEAAVETNDKMMRALLA